MNAPNPPAVYWTPKGEDGAAAAEDGAIYVYRPKDRQWVSLHLDAEIRGVAKQLPAGSEPLFCLSDVKLAIDAYHAGISEAVTVRTEIHCAARDEVLAMLHEAADCAIIRAEHRVRDAS